MKEEVTFPHKKTGEVLGVSTFRARGDALSFNTDENSSSSNENGITNNSNQSATVFLYSKVFLGDLDLEVCVNHSYHIVCDLSKRQDIY